MRARWWHAAVAIFAGVVVLAGGAVLQARPVGVAAAVVVLVAAWWLSPLRRVPSSSHWDAQQRHVRHGTLIVYWRPGSLRCLLMRWALRPVDPQSARVDWVDVWADDSGLAFLRDLNDGAERVPTVILTDGSCVSSPPPDRIVAELAA